MQWRTKLLLAATTPFLVVSLAAQATSASPGQQAKIPPPPCMTNADARRFDFWIGDWDVTPASAPTTVVGHSLVQRVSGGCAVLENWTAANGSDGKSLNSYNSTLGHWE
ncbi:MAG: hypothetical protein ACREK8_09340, partial [Gemmatimonadales bacterium]